MAEQLRDQRVIFMLGKGGVGKSTLATALAAAYAAVGARTLLIEIDSRAPIARILGVDHSYQPIEVEPHLFTMQLDGSHALEEYLALVVPGRALLHAVFASRLYQFFVQAAPGLRELMMLGKIYFESRRKLRRSHVWDRIVVDAPASGQALALLRMPSAARATFRASIVGSEAANIATWLRDPAICACVEVTTADSLAMSEVREIHAALVEMQLAPASVFFNRLPAADFDAADVASIIGSGATGADRDARSHLTEIALGEIDRVARARSALARLKHETGVAIVEVPEFSDRHGRVLIEALASHLATVLKLGAEPNPSRGFA